MILVVVIVLKRKKSNTNATNDDNNKKNDDDDESTAYDGAAMHDTMEMNSYGSILFVCLFFTFKPTRSVRIAAPTTQSGVIYTSLP